MQGSSHTNQLALIYLVCLLWQRYSGQIPQHVDDHQAPALPTSYPEGKREGYNQKSVRKLKHQERKS